MLRVVTESVARGLEARGGFVGRGGGGEAEGVYRKILEVDPRCAEGMVGLAEVLRRMGRLGEALGVLRRGREMFLGEWGWVQWLGEVAEEAGLWEEARGCWEELVRIRPAGVEGFLRLGNGCQRGGDLAGAMGWYRRAVEVEPGDARGQNNYGGVLIRSGRVAEGVARVREAVRLMPGSGELWMNLGTALGQAGEVEEAIGCLERASARDGGGEAMAALGNLLKDCGRVEEGVERLRAAVKMAPGDRAEAGSALLIALNYDPRVGAGEILEEARRWDARYGRAAGMRSLGDFVVRGRGEGTRMRIGYVSGDFREHPVARLMLPLLEGHDREGFEIVGYSDAAVGDEMTGRVRGACEKWVEIGEWSDERVAERVRADGVDVLVDLTMHMAGSRLGVFARRVAPVQVAWLAYPGTTGLWVLFFGLRDGWLVGVGGVTGERYSEETVVLPETFWCYAPECAVGVGELPARRNGFVTFGCLNAFCKVNEGVLKLWGRVMREVGGSRLILRAPAGSCRERVMRVMEREGVEAGRVEFVGTVGREEYMKLYGRIDVGLDVFPYSGHTTSLDAYWMGVPVVTCVGETIGGGGGVSQLMNLGRGELIGWTEEGFVGIARGLTRDLGRMVELRAGLRERMRGSALMDGRRFARGMDGAFREMWRRKKGPRAVADGGL